VACYDRMSSNTSAACQMELGFTCGIPGKYAVRESGRVNAISDIPL